VEKWRVKPLLCRRLFVRTGLQIARQKIKGIDPQRFGYSNELDDVQAPHSSFNFRNRSLVNFQDCSQLVLAQPAILPRLNQKAQERLVVTCEDRSRQLDPGHQ
jgi:hypothetical protein